MIQFKACNNLYFSIVRIPDQISFVWNIIHNPQGNKVLNLSFKSCVESDPHRISTCDVQTLYWLDMDEGKQILQLVYEFRFFRGGEKNMESKIIFISPWTEKGSVLIQPFTYVCAVYINNHSTVK